MRVCTVCGEAKPPAEFWRNRRNKTDGRQAKCKSCKQVIYNRFRKARGYDKTRYWRDPQKERERHLIRKYGVTLADYDRMSRTQGGACAVCRKQQNRAFDVDHDHRTGVVRGLLCTSCNRMIGHAGDAPENLLAAAAYLQRERA